MRLFLEIKHGGPCRLGVRIYLRVPSLARKAWKSEWDWMEKCFCGWNLKEEKYQQFMGFIVQTSTR